MTSTEQRLAQVRESVAGLLYVRNRLAAELAALRAADSLDAPGRPARLEDRERIERELAQAQHDARQALAVLVAVHQAARSDERQRLRARAAQLSVAIDVAAELADDPLDVELRRLPG